MPRLVKAALETLSLASTAGQLSGQPPPMIARRELSGDWGDQAPLWVKTAWHGCGLLTFSADTCGLLPYCKHNVKACSRSLLYSRATTGTTVLCFSLERLYSIVLVARG